LLSSDNGRIYVEVKTRIIMNMEEGIEVGEAIEEMDYHFASMTEGVNFDDMEIRDYEVIDSK